MSAVALAAPSDLPDLLGTSPADLVDGRIAPPPATPTDARQRAERIRAHLASYTQMRQDIADAFACHDWKALGYPSWYSYLEGEFGPELQQLTGRRDDRQLAVGDLRGQGLSTRQIAAVVGVDPKTVRNDLPATQAAAPDGKVTGSDGKSYPAQQRQVPAVRWAAESEWETVYRTLPLASEACARASGWASAVDVADTLGTTWSPSIVTRRLKALQEGGRVESSTDKALTGIRGTAWRQRPEPAQSRPGIVTVELPADDVDAATTAGTQNSPAGPAASADDPPAETVLGDSRLQDRPGADTAEPGSGYESDPERRIAAVAELAPAFVQPVPERPAGRDPQEVRAEPGEGAPRAVATTGQPGPALIIGVAEVYDYGVVHSGNRDLRVRAGRLPDDVPMVWLAVEDAGVEAELLALSPLKLNLLITRLQAAQRWIVGALGDHLADE